MPVYNAERYIALAIESILRQTFADYELIIINESTDRSGAILAEYASLDSRIRVVSHERRGLVCALNEGLDCARGKYIARMDSDDISLPERFERQIGLLEGSHGDICGCHYFVVNENGKYDRLITVPLEKRSLLLYLALGVPFAHGSVMMRTSFLKNNGLRYGQGSIHSEDKFLWIQLFNGGAKFVNVDEPLYKYRVSSTALSTKNRRNVRREDRRIRSRFVARHAVEIEDTCAQLGANTESLTSLEVQYLADMTLLLSIRSSSRANLRLLLKTNLSILCISILRYVKRYLLG